MKSKKELVVLLALAAHVEYMKMLFYVEGNDAEKQDCYEDISDSLEILWSMLN